MCAAKAFSTLPYYMGKAVNEESPIERLKLIICADISRTVYNYDFGKPMVPMLGETYEARG